MQDGGPFVLVKVSILGRKGPGEEQMRKDFHLVVLRADFDEVIEECSSILFSKPIDSFAIAQMKVYPEGQSPFFQIQILYCLLYLNLSLIALAVLLAIALLVPRFIVAAVTASVYSLILHVIMPSVVSVPEALCAYAGTDAFHAIVAAKGRVIFILIHDFRADGTNGRLCNVIRPVE